MQSSRSTFWNSSDDALDALLREIEAQTGNASKEPDSLESISHREINPSQMDATEQELLWELIQQHSSVEFINEGQLYRVETKHGSYDIELTHTLVRYECKKNPNEFRHAVQSELLSKGRMSSVFISSGTIFANHNEKQVNYKSKSAKKSNDKRRVIKVDSSGNGLIAEHLATARNPDFHIKNPIVDTTLNKQALIMRYFNFPDLFDIIFHDIEGDIQFSVDQRLTLSKMLFTALATQVHDKGLIHRDIKSENIKILLDASNNIISLRIFDFGFAKNKPSTEERATKQSSLSEDCGTAGYAPPEAYLDMVTDEMSDIFSMGRVLWLLWHADPGAFQSTNKLYDPFKSMQLTAIPAIFHDISDDELSLVHKNRIHQLLLQINDMNPESRPTIDNITRIFDAILLERKTQLAAKPNEAEIKNTTATMPIRKY